MLEDIDEVVKDSTIINYYFALLEQYDSMKRYLQFGPGLFDKIIAMDEYLQRLSRQAMTDPSAAEALQRACERIGLLGPTIANACRLMARIYRLFFNDPERTYQLHADSFANDLAEVSWRTSESDFKQSDLDLIRSFVGEAYELALQEEIELNKDKYLRPLLELYLFTYRNKGPHDGYPILYVKGERGIILREDTPEEFSELITNAARYTRMSKSAETLTYATKTLEEGHVDIYFEASSSEYADVAHECLPTLLFEQLEAESEERDLDLGAYLKKTYSDWFFPAMWNAYESFVYSEMRDNYVNTINETVWESGAVAIFIDEGSEQSQVGRILIWISLDNLVSFAQEKIKEGEGNWLFDDVLEDLEEFGAHFEDHYYGTDKELLKESLLESVPEKFKDLV